MSPGHKQQTELQTHGQTNLTAAAAATAANVTALVAPAVDQSQHATLPHAAAPIQAQPSQQNGSSPVPGPDAGQAQQLSSQQQGSVHEKVHAQQAQGSGPVVPGAAAQQLPKHNQHGVPQPDPVQHASTGAAAVQQHLRISQHDSAEGSKAQQVVEVKQGSRNDSALDQHSAGQLPGQQASQQGTVRESTIKAAATGD